MKKTSGVPANKSLPHKRQRKRFSDKQKRLISRARGVSAEQSRALVELLSAPTNTELVARLVGQAAVMRELFDQLLENDEE